MILKPVTIISLGLVLACLATPARAQLHAELVVSGFVHPVAFVQDPSQANVQFVVEQRGLVRGVVDGQLQHDFLDISDVVSNNNEGGLLGLAFSPDYASSRRFFVYFTNADNNTVVARFRRATFDPM